MKRLLLKLLKLLGLLTWMTILAAPLATGSPLTVGAAASLHQVLTEVASSYERPVKLHFAATSLVARQIEWGAPIDVFISADLTNMDRLEKAGLIRKTSRLDLLAGKLVLIAPKGTAYPRKLADLSSAKIKHLALCDRAVPVGGYARGLLENRGLLHKLADKIVKPADARGVVSMVAERAVDAGFVYRTDARAHTDTVRVVESFPEVQVRYPAAIVTKSSKINKARHFLNYLRHSAKARALFARFGFRPLPLEKAAD